MSRHTTYRGVTIDMDSMMRENEKTPALGNMSVNARGDKISKGGVTKTADQIARENHRVQTAIINTGLKGNMPAGPEPIVSTEKPLQVKTPVKKTKEKELPTGDIVMEDDNDES